MCANFALEDFCANNKVYAFSLHYIIHGDKTAQSLTVPIMAMAGGSPPVRCGVPGVGPATADAFHVTLSRSSYGNPALLAAGLKYSGTLAVELTCLLPGHVHYSGT